MDTKYIVRELKGKEGIRVLSEGQDVVAGIMTKPHPDRHGNSPQPEEIAVTFANRRVQVDFNKWRTELVADLPEGQVIRHNGWSGPDFIDWCVERVQSNPSWQRYINQ